MFFRLYLKNERLVPIKIELGQLVVDPEQVHFKIGYKLEAKQLIEQEHAYQGRAIPAQYSHMRQRED